MVAMEQLIDRICHVIDDTFQIIPDNSHTG